MPLYDYECMACGAVTERFKSVTERNDCPECPRCGKTMQRLFVTRPQRATCGEIVSVNAGVGVGQVTEANKMMAAAGLPEVKFDRGGNMHAPDRNTYLKALKVRGLHNNDEIRG